MNLQNISKHTATRYLFKFRAMLLSLFCIFVISCKEQKTSFAKEQTASIPLLKQDFTTANDTVRLSDIAEEVEYISLDIPNTKHLFQAQYSNSLIFANDNDSLYWFNHKGRKVKSIPLKFGCFDLSEHQDSIYTYTPSDKRLSCYDLRGNRMWTSRLHYKEKEVGFYGHSFVRINDSLFAIAIQNQGFNPDQLIIINKRGKTQTLIPNAESFSYPGVCHTTHTDWKRTLTRNGKEIFYHPLYGDTVYHLYGNKQPTPYMIEQMVKKVPLEARPEYTGKTWKEFDAACLEDTMYVTRIFNTSRYAIVEYKLGSIGHHMSNYWIYDKKEKSLKRTFNDLSASLNEGKAHFGIFNDYDGGLAFAPDFISNERLIMVNAGTLQGNKSVYAKHIYSHNLPMMKNKYRYRSDICQNPATKKKADDFWANCDEKKLTLTIVKMKK